jgi:hypothetical protein
MRKGFGIILALCVGGAVVYGVHEASAPTEASAYQQQTQPANTQTTTAPTGTPTQPAQTTTLSNNNYYTNSSGNQIHSPAKSSNGMPAGATAQCGDGSYSFSQHRQGTCSHHGGVARWL